MKSINKFFLESYPNNPFDVVLKNKYYPQGIREIDIYSYYIQSQKKILDWIDGRTVAFRIRLDEKTSVIRRKIDGSPIKLTPANFESIIHGRINSIYVEQPIMTDYFVIDIDPGAGLGRKDSLKIEKTCRKILSDNMDVKRFESISSSSIGIHLLGYMPRKYNVSRLKLDIKTILTNNINDQKVLIDFSKGRMAGAINLDLGSMARNQLHVSRYSLNKDFLVVDTIDRGLIKI